MSKLLGVLALVAIFVEVNPAPTDAFSLRLNDGTNVKQYCCTVL